MQYYQGTAAIDFHEFLTLYRVPYILNIERWKTSFTPLLYTNIDL